MTLTLVTEARLTLPSGHVTVFDAADLPLVEQFKWHVLKARRTCYAQTKGGPANGRQRTYLHRLLMNAPAGLLVDHINHDGLDNRRSNLRLATPGQNVANSGPRSGDYRGIFVSHHRSKPWRARIQTRHIGYYATEWEAAEAYNEAALAEYGEFALLNVRRVA